MPIPTKSFVKRKLCCTRLCDDDHHWLEYWATRKGLTQSTMIRCAIQIYTSSIAYCNKWYAGELFALVDNNYKCIKRKYEDLLREHRDLLLVHNDLLKKHLALLEEGQFDA